MWKLFSGKRWLSKEDFTEWFKNIINQFDRQTLDSIDETVYVKQININIYDFGPMLKAHICLVNASFRVRKFSEVLVININDEINSELELWIRINRISKKDYWTFSILGEDQKSISITAVH